MPKHLTVRTSCYLNDLVEQDCRRVKQRGGPMLGFGSFATAEVTLSGVELTQKPRKGQFELAGIGRGVPVAWEAVLAA